jgi:hypothetical protein
MKSPGPTPIDATIVAVPETAGSALYGMLDVLLAIRNPGQKRDAPRQCSQNR